MSSESGEPGLALIDHLERQRAINNQAMWLAPVLVVAGQAFLLQVLSDGELATSARLVVLIAGLLASGAALLTLLRGRGREIQYSEAIAHESDKVGLPDMRLPERLEGKRLVSPSRANRVDRRLAMAASHKSIPSAPLLWELTLVAFFVADLVVFCAT